MLCIIFSFTTSAFLSFRNLLNILDQVTVLGIIAIGMTAVIVNLAERLADPMPPRPPRRPEGSLPAVGAVAGRDAGL